MNDDCLFCRIVRGEIPAEIVHEGNNVVAFKDINPQAPVHLLLIPRKHIATLADLESSDAPLMGEIITTAADLARNENLDRDGFRVAINSGPAAGQTVFHVHVHLLGGRNFDWPPG